MTKQQQKNNNRRRVACRTTIVFNDKDRKDFIRWNSNIRESLNGLWRSSLDSLTVPTKIKSMPDLMVGLELRRIFRLRESVNVEFNKIEEVMIITPVKRKQITYSS